jgi:hypothetical protein
MINVYIDCRLIDTDIDMAKVAERDKKLPEKIKQFYSFKTDEIS